MDMTFGITRRPPDPTSTTFAPGLSMSRVRRSSSHGTVVGDGRYPSTAGSFQPIRFTPCCLGLANPTRESQQIARPTFQFLTVTRIHPTTSGHQLPKAPRNMEAPVLPASQIAQ